MFKSVKDWFVEAVSNGGAILILVIALIVGGVGEVIQPVSLVRDAFSDSTGPASSPIDPTLISLGETAMNDWKCPDARWTRVSGGGGTLGPAYVSCKAQGIEIRHFVRSVAGMTEPDTAMDTNTYPFQTITIEEAINRVR